MDAIRSRASLQKQVGEYACRVCGATFASENELIQHKDAYGHIFSRVPSAASVNDGLRPEASSDLILKKAEYPLILTVISFFAIFAVLLADKSQFSPFFLPVFVGFTLFMLFTSAYFLRLLLTTN